MEIREIDINNPLYEKTLDLRTKVISIPFGFPFPTKETETPGSHMFDKFNLLYFDLIM